MNKKPLNPIVDILLLGLFALIFTYSIITAIDRTAEQIANRIGGNDVYQDANK